MAQVALAWFLSNPGITYASNNQPHLIHHALIINTHGSQRTHCWNYQGGEYHRLGKGSRSRSHSEEATNNIFIFFQGHS